MIDWANFTPWQALAGGLLIGIGVAILWLYNGRIAGVSGIIGGLFKAAQFDIGWRVAFIIGLIAAPLAWQLFAALPTIVVEANHFTLAIAGLLVGVGTRLGTGCTSGHGVCGIARLSVRSIIATVTFMLSGIVVVWLMRHWIGS